MNVKVKEQIKKALSYETINNGIVQIVEGLTQLVIKALKKPFRK